MNKNENSEHKIHISYFVLAFAIFFIVSYFVILFIESEISKVKLDELKSNERRVINLERDSLSSELYGVFSDIHYLHEAFNEDILAGNQWVNGNWTVFANNKKMYDQIRYIDERGNEKIRINYVPSGAYSVEEWELQNKKNRYYFLETLKLENEEVYVSPLDLNVEKGEIELPYKPMIRFGTPVFNDMGNKKGVIILNYLAKDLLDHFKTIAKNSDGEIMLLNSEGYWISSHDPDNEWNFMFDSRKESTFEKEFVGTWDEIISGEELIINGRGMFSVEKYNIIDAVNVLNRNGYSDITLSEETWYIVSFVEKNKDNEIIFNTGIGFLVSVYIKNRLYFRLITLISFIVGLLVYITRRTYSQVKYYSEYDSLTNVYNRRAGLERVDEKVASQNRRNFKMSLCFVDINGLKVVNDSLGHKHGDELIINSVKVIVDTIRDSDFVLRMGGDEFLIVFEGIGKDESEAVWERIIQEYKNINDRNEFPFVISVSHGIVEIDNLNRNVDMKLKEADEKMYLEKKDLKMKLNVLK